MKPISFQSTALVFAQSRQPYLLIFVCVFSQHIGKKTNEYLKSAEQIPGIWNVDQLAVLITSWDIT